MCKRQHFSRNSSYGGVSVSGHASLFLWQLPQMDTLSDLSRNIGLSSNIVRNMTKNTRRFYLRLSIPKRRGGSRVIYAPSRSLKAAQRWILRNVLEHIPVSTASTAYRGGCSPRANAERHSGNSFFLLMDLRDFFPSIKALQVYSVFRALGYNDHVCHLLTSLCTLRGTLPQGAATSPLLSNIICRRLDLRLSRLAGARHVVYTRYADDITFSSSIPEAVQRCKLLAHRIIRDEGFMVNEYKTRVIGKRKQPIVTGFTIVEGTVRVPKAFRRRLRAVLFRMVFEKDGIKKQALQHRVNGLSAHLFKHEQERAEVYRSKHSAQLLKFQRKLAWQQVAVGLRTKTKVRKPAKP